MWWLRLTSTVLGVVVLSLAVTLLTPDLNPMTRNLGLGVVVALAIIGTRWASKSCAEPGKMALALAGCACLGGIMLAAIAQPTPDELEGTLELGVIVRVGLRRGAMLLATAMGPMAVFELLRWRLEKAIAKMSDTHELAVGKRPAPWPTKTDSASDFERTWTALVAPLIEASVEESGTKQGETNAEIRLGSEESSLAMPSSLMR